MECGKQGKKNLKQILPLVYYSNEASIDTFMIRNDNFIKLPLNLALKLFLFPQNFSLILQNITYRDSPIEVTIRVWCYHLATLETPQQEAKKLIFFFFPYKLTEDFFFPYINNLGGIYTMKNNFGDKT